jgi:exonuclease SbcD
MKIVHTADWHLCDVLHRVSRTDDLRARVRAVAAICDSEKADVLVIAGDLFSDHSAVGADKITEELDHLQKTFEPFFRAGGTILAITGNHDKDRHVEMVRAGMKLGALPRVGGGPLLAGRMYLQNGPGVCSLETGGERVQFVLVPYPTYPRYAEADDNFTGADERNRAVQNRVGQWVQQAQLKPGFDPTLPSVLVAHLHVRGSETHTLYKLTERDDMLFEAGFVPTHWAYVALGHIHKPQCLGGASHVRYCGPLDRLDFGERDNDRGVVVVEIGKRFGPECRTEPLWISIPPNSMHEIAVDSTDVDFLATRYPDRETAIVKISVTLTPNGPSRDELTLNLRRLFPRFAEITFEPTPGSESDSETPRVGVRTQADYRATVREYLNEQIACNDQFRDELLQLVETFFTASGATT